MEYEYEYEIDQTTYQLQRPFLLLSHPSYSIRTQFNQEFVLTLVDLRIGQRFLLGEDRAQDGDCAQREGGQELHIGKDRD